MLEDSDTESDTSSISPSGYESLLLTSSTAGSTSLILIAETAQKSLHALMDIDVDRIKNELTEQDSDCIQRASTALQTLLDAFSYRTSDCMRCPEAMCALYLILQVGCLERLFQLRQLFHIIAAQEVSGHNTKISIICWADVILARLGEAIQAIIEGFHPPPSPRTLDSGTLLRHRDEISLHAALQLPHNWDDTISIISSEYASPATIRLVVRLVFAAYILSPKLVAKDEAFRDWPACGPPPERILKILRSFVHRVFNTTSDTSNEIGRVDQTTCAMILSMYALADITRCARTNSLIRPHTGATLLSLIRFATEDSVGSLKNTSLIQVTSNLNVAQSIIHKWGITVPWMWLMWQDERILDYVIVEHATASWLYHLCRQPWPLNDGPVDYQATLLNNLSIDLPSSMYAISIMLNRAITAFCSPSPTPSIEVLETIYRCCWAGARILEVTNEHRSTVVQSIVESLGELFVHLPDDIKAAEVKDIIIVGLAGVEAKVLRSALSVCAAKNIFKMKLEDKMSLTAQRIISTTGTSPQLSQADLMVVTQILHLLILEWHARVEKHIYKDSILLFMKAAFSQIASQARHDHAASMLLGPFIVAQTLLEASHLSDDDDGTTTKQRRDTIWDLSLAEEVTNISATSAFAAYISATVRSMKDIYIVEAWNQMRDFIFLVYRRSFGGTDEPLALLVCPAVCIALQDLLRHGSAAFVEFLRTSPWTRSFCDALVALSDSEGDDEYHQFVRSSLRGDLSTLCGKIKHRVFGDRSLAHPQPTSIPASRLFCYEDDEGIQMLMIYQ